jgi:hypothetical protein
MTKENRMQIEAMIDKQRRGRGLWLIGGMRLITDVLSAVSPKSECHSL